MRRLPKRTVAKRHPADGVGLPHEHHAPRFERGGGGGNHRLLIRAGHQMEDVEAQHRAAACRCDGAGVAVNDLGIGAQGETRQIGDVLPGLDADHPGVLRRIGP